MKMKKIISTICSLAMLVSMFGAFAMTAKAANEPVVVVRCTTAPTESNKKAAFEIVFTGLGAGDKVSAAQVALDASGEFPFVFNKDGAKIVITSGTPSTPDAIVNDRINFGWFAGNDLPTADANGEFKFATIEMALAAGKDVADTALSLNVFTGQNKTMISYGSDEMGEDNYCDATDGSLLATNWTGTVGSGPKAPAITGVTVTPATATVKPGESATFTATVAGTDGSDENGATIEYDKKVTWTVSDTTNASVDANGVVTVKDSAPAGTTITVTATSVGDATKSNSATVKVGGAAVELSVSANSDVKDYPVQKVSISKAADADVADVEAFKTAVSGKKAVVLVTGKTADDVVVGSAYVIVDGTAIADGIDAAAVELGSVGVMGATKCEVSLIVDGNALVTAK